MVYDRAGEIADGGGTIGELAAFLGFISLGFFSLSLIGSTISLWLPGLLGLSRTLCRCRVAVVIPVVGGIETRPLEYYRYC